MRISDALAESLLLQSGAFTAKQLTELHAQSQKAKKPLQDLIIEHSLLSEAALTNLYAQELGLPFVEVPAGHISHQVLNRLPEHVADRYKAVVFDIDDGDDSTLVAIEDPLDAQSLSFLKKRLGDNLKLHITTGSLMKDALEQYRNPRSNALVKVMAYEDSAADPQIVNAALVAEGSAAAESIHHIVEQGLMSGASDIHIEPRVDHVLIRFRIDGLLHEAHKLPLSTLGLLVGSVKTAGKLKLSEHHAPQYGQWNIALGEHYYAIRATVLPTIDGEKVVLHIVPESVTPPNLRDLGLWGSGLRDLQSALTEPRGTIFVAGPIGSGKATTLFAMVSLLHSPNVNIATVEDPLKYRITGANQVQVNPSLGMTFANALRAVLAQDPNIVMLSELRDSESSKLVLQAAQSGHLIFSALASTSAAAGVRRLLTMDNEPFLIVSSLRAIVGQRLARRLCPECREEVAPDTSTLKQVEKCLRNEGGGWKRLHELEAAALAEVGGDSAELSTTARGLSRVWQAHSGGCEYCHNTGYRGRVGMFEVLTATDKVQKAILSNASTAVIHKAAKESGMVGMQLDGVVKALRGQTTLSEVFRVSTY
jgi:type IV pilus assembly protein PilB